mmetsp:Transcript_43677/g.105350  ORF Transcript_43677/g.105350 Transcript_43677/m.105350 type:complete len:243 (-) Transcript_43677:123-851(-)|eukprot:CAMPEP_0113653092 /NCGR_PEP_ID=MMETSP0017_2-20120614/28381_1 /TAXON_ID=2856 /ORGANISM="Cylindrotheca closterium" /LENGTH=242 /DNA_ID=CAMNT_0000566035 /DNA_START=44 /DNA_END=772 /DNA_ORIENTATION=- /assembly_acc=CAM_ASM_000147
MTQARRQTRLALGLVCSLGFLTNGSQGFTLTPSSATKTVDMGQDKLVSIYCQTEQEEETSVVLPSADIALARMMAHCPALIEGKNVMELNSGVGLVSATACRHARPEHVAVTDWDPDALSMAYFACTRLQRPRNSVSRCRMDWSLPSTWPNQKYDLVLASDVLSDDSCILPLTQVLQYYLAPSSNNDDEFRKRALIVDPIDQFHRRNAFCYAAKKAGLDVSVSDFPGMDGFVLLDVFSKDAY